MPARAPASIDMLQTVIRSSMDSASTAAPVYSSTCPAPPRGGDLSDQVENQVLGGHATLEGAVDAQLKRLRLELQQCLRRQHVLNLAGPNAKGQGAERAVRRCVAVAAHDRRAWLCVSQLGPDDVNDALFGVVQIGKA